MKKTYHVTTVSTKVAIEADKVTVENGVLTLWDSVMVPSKTVPPGEPVETFVVAAAFADWNGCWGDGAVKEDKDKKDKKDKDHGDNVGVDRGDHGRDNVGRDHGKDNLDIRRHVTEPPSVD